MKYFTSLLLLIIILGCSAQEEDYLVTLKFELKKDSLSAKFDAKYSDPVLVKKVRKNIRRTTFLQEKESTLQLIKQNISGHD